MAKNRNNTGDQGGPALAMADDNIRCEKLIARDGATERCSRFSIKLPDGSRDAFCVSHSSTEHAARVRRRGVLARNASNEAERERRRQFADEFASEPWQTPYDITLARAALAHRLLLGEVSAADVREVRALLDAAERQMRVPAGQWQILPV